MRKNKNITIEKNKNINIKNKKGIVLSTLITIIIILTIIISTVTTFSFNYIQEKKKKELIMALQFVESETEQLIISNKIYDRNIYSETSQKNYMKVQYNEYAGKDNLKSYNENIIPVKNLNLGIPPVKFNITVNNRKENVFDYIAYDLQTKKAYYLGPKYVYYDKEKTKPIYCLRENDK